MPHTPREAADLLYATMPHDVSMETLQAYGIEGAEDQRQHLAKEVFYLNLYWIRAALREMFGTRRGERVFTEVRGRIESAWKDFALQGDPVVLVEEAERRRAFYDRVAGGGGPPISIFQEVTTRLETEGTVTRDARQQVLALLIDFVPAEDYGELLSELELTDE